MPGRRWRSLDLRRASAWLAGLWLGLVVGVAAIATPAPFAVLAQADAGRVVAIVLSREATASLVMGLTLALLARWRARRGEVPQFGATLALPLAAMLCTIIGYHVLQPMMAQARTGSGSLSFGQLHAVSLGCFALKMILVAALGWRLALSADGPVDGLVDGSVDGQQPTRHPSGDPSP